MNIRINLLFDVAYNKESAGERRVADYINEIMNVVEEENIDLLPDEITSPEKLVEYLLDNGVDVQNVGGMSVVDHDDVIRYLRDMPEEEDEEDEDVLDDGEDLYDVSENGTVVSILNKIVEKLETIIECLD